MRQLLWLLLFLPMLVFASTPELQAILGEKVVVKFRGERLMLSPGKPRQGITLVGVRGDSAILRIGNVERAYRLGESKRVTTRYSQPDDVTVNLEADISGMYHVDGAINGYPMSFLVDTGATSIAMNASHASRLEIDFRSHGQPTVIATASRREQGYLINLDEVQVGEITVSNVSAVVIDNSAFPPVVLLGNSFLNRLDMSRAGSTLILKQR